MVLRFLSATFIEQGAGTAGLGDGPLFLWISLGVGVLGLIFALIMARSVLASDTGTPEMQLISNAIREGAEGVLPTFESADDAIKSRDTGHFLFPLNKSLS